MKVNRQKSLHVDLDLDLYIGPKILWHCYWIIILTRKFIFDPKTEFGFEWKLD